MTPLEATDIERLRELLAKACTENVALRVLLGAGCDANDDGEHSIVKSGKDQFCHKCGDMTRNGKSKPWMNEARLERTIARLRRMPLETATRVKVLEEALENEERRHLVTIDQRDQAEAAADMLAHDIGRICDIDVGEHSNLNSPWANAHEAATERTALTASEDDRGSKGEGRG